MSRYLPRELGYPFYWDEPPSYRREPRRVVPVQAQPALRRRPDPEPLSEPDPMLEENRALKRSLESLRAELAAKEVELEELSRLTKQHRLRAIEAQNEIELAKERVHRESAKELEQKRRAFAADFLEVLDDLDRAVSVARESAPDSALAEGVELVRKRFLAKLEAHDIRHDPAEGKPFDPERHEAVSTAPVDDPELDRVVVAVVQEGYVAGDKTLRPARVVVGKYAGPE